MRAISVKTMLWLLLLVVPACAAETGAWNCDGKFGLCRYLSSATKQEIIPPRFERAMPFSEGVAAVSIGGRFGYVDERGEVVVEPRFDLAGEFSHGLAEVLIGDKTGVINRKGEIVVQPMFQRAIPLTSEVIVAVEGTWRSGYYAGFERLPGFSESAFGLSNSGLYHTSGYWVRKPDLKRVGRFDSEGRGLIWASDRTDNRNRELYGLLASNGEWIVQPQYEYVGPLIDERATVRKLVDGVVLSGAVDPAGQIKVPLRTWALYYWKNGLANAQESYQGGKQALIDNNGNILGGRYFDKVERAEKGDISKVLIDGRWMGLDRAGNLVPNPDNGRLLASCPNGMRAISVDGKVQITDAGGKPTTSHLFDPLVQRPTCDKPFSVKLDARWGFVDVDGHLLFDPPSFTNQYDFEGGYAAVFEGEKWRLIDTSGRAVMPAKFEKYLGRREGLFNVVIEGREVWLTVTGEERPEPPIRHIPSPQITECGHGLRLIERDGLWGIADAEGKDVIVPRYRAVDCFRNGIAWAAIDSRRQWCALGPNGELRDRPDCRTIHYPYSQTHSYPEVFDEDRFENSVLWSRAYFEFGSGRREIPPRWISDGARTTSSRRH
jgi:hypothetical protein